MRAYFKLCICICFLLSTGVLFAQSDQSDEGNTNKYKHFEVVSLGYSNAEVYDTKLHGINIALEIFEIPQGATIYHGIGFNAIGLFSEGTRNFVGVLGFGPKIYWGTSKDRPMDMVIAFSPQISIFTMNLGDGPDSQGMPRLSNRETFSGLSGNLEIKLLDVKNFSLSVTAGVHLGTKYSFVTRSANISYRLP